MRRPRHGNACNGHRMSRTAIGANATRSEGKMKPARLARLIDELFEGNRTRAAELLGCEARTVRRYLSGELPIPRATGLLFEVMAARKIAPAKVRELAA